MMNVDEARAARREGRRVEWWSLTKGGWRRGLVRTISRESGTAVVIETGHTRGTKVQLEKLRSTGEEKTR
jgi:hypothetical protein